MKCITIFVLFIAALLFCNTSCTPQEENLVCAIKTEITNQQIFQFPINQMMGDQYVYQDDVPVPVAQITGITGYYYSYKENDIRYIIYIDTKTTCVMVEESSFNSMAFDMQQAETNLEAYILEKGRVGMQLDPDCNCE